MLPFVSLRSKTFEQSNKKVPLCLYFLCESRDILPAKGKLHVLKGEGEVKISRSWLAWSWRGCSLVFWRSKGCFDCVWCQCSGTVRTVCDNYPSRTAAGVACVCHHAFALVSASG